ncbi:MAG: hypothetical protein WCI36_00880 [bacterium]
MKPGDKFIYECAIADGEMRYGISCYIKLQKPVTCYNSLTQMNESSKSDNEKAACLIVVCGRNKPYTAITTTGEPAYVPDDADILKLG